MGTLHSNPKTLALAKRVRKAWGKGQHKTYSSLARAFNLDPGQARRIVLGEILKGGDPWPEGNCRPYTAHGKQFIIYDDGRVWSVTSNKFVGSDHKSGYKVIKVITATGEYLNLRVSRLMLEVFVRPPKKGEFARHLDDDRSNNTLRNLAWGLPIANSADMVYNGNSAYGERNVTAKLTDDLVLLLITEYDGSSYKGFAKTFIRKHCLDIGMLAIVRVLRGSTWTHLTECGLPDSAVRAIHVHAATSKLNLAKFCRKFAKYLNAKGFQDVLPFHIRGALTGRMWESVYAEFHGK